MTCCVIDGMINMKYGVLHKLENVVIVGRVKNANTFSARSYESGQAKFG